MVHHHQLYIYPFHVWFFYAKSRLPLTLLVYAAFPNPHITPTSYLNMILHNEIHHI